MIHVQVALGGEVVRQYTSVDYTGRGGEAELYGLYFADAGQHLEHRLLVDHGVPDCRSYVAYRGALQGERAHTIWVGDVLIRAEATGTDTYEVNRNLVLTDGARADSVPNLEIETGEVIGAGHASATGRFDDEQLFYLMSRGIPEAEARKLVVRGFFAELLGKIPVEELRERLGATIEARLAKAGRCDDARWPRSDDACSDARAVMSEFVRVASIEDVPKGTVVAVEVDGTPIALVQRARTAPKASSPSTTSARTRRSRCPRARSTGARWNAGCTARVSTSARASPPGCQPPNPYRSIPSRSATATYSSARSPSNGVSP